MADIAAVFHWRIADMEGMEVEELLAWQRRAVARWPFGDDS